MSCGCSSKSLPSLPKLATNAGAAAVRVGWAVVTGREVFVSPATFNLRLSQCLNCPHVIETVGKKTGKTFHRCGVCGCLLDSENKLAAKAWLATEACPLPEPKWEAVR